ncbi:AAA family ATPase [Brevibacterium sp. BRM-1]|uniref:AAA family ATPase n=1 Tax=Brevibacterium sp. BRM-1 TaxID=2999062 RepID=UPI0022825507|nr:AAA family ATPase [Brevibacterium sp. BRM-1]WAL41093.1 AAA family ATPase [Brevibacterium sp. BRM-1]
MTDATAEQITAARSLAERANGAMNTVLEGKAEVVSLTVTALLAGGHLLLEDVPGVGKTLLAKTLARVVGGSVRRIQFTPDLLPSDVLGVNLFNQESRHFEFRAGPIFSNVVIADEINRASPKTQSAMLECMAESQASVDGTTYLMPSPFMVIATQNPIDMEGTYSLPEAQRDRFMMRSSVGYPAPAAEADLLLHQSGREALEDLRPVASLEDVVRAREAVRSITASPQLRGYIVALLAATRADPGSMLGASPRGGLHLLRAAQVRALLAGRGFVTPDDVQALAVSVLAHRIIRRDSDDPADAAAAVREAVARTAVQ